MWRIDPERSRVEFVGRHLMITTVKGHFGGVTGTLVIDGSDPAGSSVDAAIDASSINTREPDRDSHLRSSEVLDVAHHPHIGFQSRFVEPVAGAEARYRIVGDLTVRGVTHEVVLGTTFLGHAGGDVSAESAARAKAAERPRPAEPLKSGPDTRRLIFSATTTISRKAFGATWNSALDAGGWLVGDELRVRLDVEVVQA